MKHISGTPVFLLGLSAGERSLDVKLTGRVGRDGVYCKGLEWWEWIHLGASTSCMIFEQVTEPFEFLAFSSGK